MDPLTARRTWRTPEMIHGLVYFAPEATEAYAALGVSGRAGYFASRSAPMGATSAELVIATFFNFEPAHVRRAMAGVWDTVTPAALLDARRDAAGAALRRILGAEVAESSDVKEAAVLARRAAQAACAHLSGKPLFAGHASLPWPDDPLLVLWHAQTLLREFRGDIHIGAMTAEGIEGCEALVTHAATGEISRDVAGKSRLVGRPMGRGHRVPPGQGPPRLQRLVHTQGRREPSTGRGPDRCRGCGRLRRPGRRGLPTTPVPLPADVSEDRRGRRVHRAEVTPTRRDGSSGTHVGFA